MKDFTHLLCSLILLIMGTSPMRAQSINVTWPVANQEIASIRQDGTLCKFTSTKDYAQVTIHLKNDNPLYISHDLQVRYFDNVKAGVEYNVTTAVPGEKVFNLFKGDDYTMVIKAIVNYWDSEYDTMVEIPIKGDGIEHEKVSDVKFTSITPVGTPFDPGKLPIKGGKVTLEFDGPIASLTAVNALGQEGGGKVYNGTAVAGSDNKVWELSFGDLSELASAETEYITFNLGITAKDADGGAIVFDDTKSDFRLEASWILVDEKGEDDPPAPKKELGDLAFSIENMSEFDASDSMSVSVDFPNATGYDGMGLQVFGALYDQNFGFTAISSEGIATIGEAPATIILATKPKYQYNLAITKICIYNQEGTLAETLDNQPYNVNFTTTATPTAISSIEGERGNRNGKFLRNGKVVIVKEGEEYQTNGMK